MIKGRRIIQETSDQYNCVHTTQGVVAGVLMVQHLPYMLYWWYDVCVRKCFRGYNVTTNHFGSIH